MNTNEIAVNALLSGVFTKSDIEELSFCTIERLEGALPANRRTALHLFWRITAELCSSQLGRDVHIEEVKEKARGSSPYGAAAHFVNDQSNH